MNTPGALASRTNATRDNVESMFTRREFLSASGAVALGIGAKPAPALRIGVMDGVLRLPSKPEAAAKAQSLGLMGVQVTLGQNADKSRLLLEDATLQRAWVEAAKRARVTLNATYIDILHVNCLKQDPKAAEFVSRGIATTKAIGAPILMTVFFGKCALLSRAETDYAIDAFRELAQEAARAKIVIGFENVLLADENLRGQRLKGDHHFIVALVSSASQNHILGIYPDISLAGFRDRSDNRVLRLQKLDELCGEIDGRSLVRDIVGENLVSRP